MSKSVLLLQLLDLLKSDPTLNAGDLARELGRSERTIYRYLQALSLDLSVPVYFEDGYKVAGRPRLAPINFSEEEAIALRLALSAGPIRRTEPLNRHATSALRKVEAAMSEASFKLSQAVAGRVTWSATGHETQSISEALLSLLESAVIQQKTLALNYRSLQSQKPRPRDFDPYALVYRRHTWYLIGLCHERRMVIQLKAGRITSARETQRTFQRPESFSVDAFYESSWEVLTGEPVRVEILFDAEVARLVMETQRHPTQETHQRDDGSVIFTAEVAGFAEIGWWTLSFGGAAEVLNPLEFREWMKAHASRLATRYDACP
ncbi:MAG: transcriptional regulator [Armatimonadetes bacterium]|nr:transcriptional regulator [Armatimonadota bacterium]